MANWQNYQKATTGKVGFGSNAVTTDNIKPNDTVGEAIKKLSLTAAADKLVLENSHQLTPHSKNTPTCNYNHGSNRQGKLKAPRNISKNTKPNIGTVKWDGSCKKRPFSEVIKDMLDHLFNSGGYFHSCLCKVTWVHTSKNCHNKKKTHKDDATLTNKMVENKDKKTGEKNQNTGK